ncbi:hypothetical protein [Mesorhizobium sp. M1B.F.Ca.ET.045.04.1.1]|nr:hypothetical protein [Mesorhizobium sp. M1B.F.Ca.ET.045.04.1.1]
MFFVIAALAVFAGVASMRFKQGQANPNAGNFFESKTTAVQ